MLSSWSFRVILTQIVTWFEIEMHTYTGLLVGEFPVPGGGQLTIGAVSIITHVMIIKLIG